ncbi:hypothetical protein [Brachybacterium timonense]|uniref:hypothetical protein n=1 Tax=Brachybacterium timonense TaxID=2050896 RepID=UPI000D0B7BD3|nr:hypothetical protein [Brachybacterium timonense]
MEPTPTHWAYERTSLPAQGPGGRAADLTAWGWSQDDPAQARTRAQERLTRLVQRWRSGEIRASEAYYPDMPVREQVLDQVRAADGTLLAEVTRNRYGARCLVTDAVFIADVDLPDEPSAQRGASPKRSFMDRLLGRPAPQPEPAAAPATDPAEAAAIERVLTAVAPHPQWDVRIYRTRAGLRVVICGSDLQPREDATSELFTAMAVDPLYARLCRNQGTYRARLTAKPWRLRGVETPRISWPAASDQEQQRVQRWVTTYEGVAAGTQVCALREHRPGQVSEAEQLVLDLHDRVSAAQQRATSAQDLV